MPHPGFTHIATAFGTVANVTVPGNVMADPSLLIEQVLDVDDNVIEALYACPDIKARLAECGCEILDFGGGEQGITALMLSQVPEAVIADARFGNGRPLGRARAREIVRQLNAAVNKEPYL